MAPYLTLMKEDAPQREHSLREVFNGLRYIVRTGVQWRFMPNDLPPWHTVYQQTQRWLKAGVFEDMVHDLRMLLREIEGRNPQPQGGDPRQPHAAVEPRERRAGRLRRAQATQGLQGAPGGRHAGPTAGGAGHAGQRAGPGAGGRPGRAGPGRRPASRSRSPLSTRATPASSRRPTLEQHGIRLEVVKLPTAKRGFVLLPRRWVVERSFAWMARFRRLARDYERLAETLAGLHFVAFAILMAHRFVTFMVQSA